MNFNQLKFGMPGIDVILNLFATIIYFFSFSIVISVIIIFIAKKWNSISFSKVLKLNSFLYLTLIAIYLLSFKLGLYRLSFSRKNDWIEKVLYVFFFLILFLCQAFFLFYKKTPTPFTKKYKTLTLFIYLISLVYILNHFFPIDSYDKYLTHSKTYIYFATKEKIKLKDNSTLKMDSAISVMRYYSNEKNLEEDLMFKIYFNSPHTNLPFSFKALDSTNEFGGSSSQPKYKEMFLKKLNDSIKIVIHNYSEKNIDTILFVKRKIRKTQYN